MTLILFLEFRFLGLIPFGNIKFEESEVLVFGEFISVLKRLVVGDEDSVSFFVLECNSVSARIVACEFGD